jgi:hypothetical protein
MYKLKCGIPRGGLQGSKRLRGRPSRHPSGCPAASHCIRTPKMMISSKSSAAAVVVVAIAKRVGNPKSFGLPCALGRTTKTTCNRGACIRPCSALLVAGTRIIDGCSLRCAIWSLPSSWSRLANPVPAVKERLLNSTEHWKRLIIPGPSASTFFSAPPYSAPSVLWPRLGRTEHSEEGKIRMWFQGHCQTLK